MAQRVRIPHRGRKSFVCQTTPHFDSTSRGVSYSVLQYHTQEVRKSKPPFSFFRKDNEKTKVFGYYDEKTFKNGRIILDFCAFLLYNDFNLL